MQTALSSKCAKPAARPACVEAAIIHAIAYVDVFDYPLTPDEAHRYLARVAAPREMVERLLANGRLALLHLSQREGYVTLAGREEIVAIRKRRAAIARLLWPEAIRYGRMLGALPFVRMVAVTGSLAVDNAERHADIDYLIITANDRLWLSRAFAILIVRLAARRGIPLCPNYLLSERALVFEERNLYTAHELTQMVPLTGYRIYQHVRRLNGWADEWLPNASGLPEAAQYVGPRPRGRGRRRRLLEWPLASRAGAYLERWEMERKIKKLQLQNDSEVEARFAADWCKGHFGGHARRILDAYAERIRALEIEA